MEEQHFGTVAQSDDLKQHAQQLSRGDGDLARPQLPGLEVRELLGAGTFGEVWAGIQKGTGQRVAIKLFRHTGADWSYIRNEIEQLARVAEHPNVVTLLGADLDNDPPFYTMPLHEDSLARHCQAGPVSVEQAVIWIEQMAVGLNYIHSKGLLHCDLKPANVLLDDAGRARLADFGQAMSMAEGRTNLGTLGFMAPEQLRRHLGDPFQEPDPRWDLYALGATAYYLLTGHAPRMDQATRQNLSQSENATERLKHFEQLSFKRPLVPLRALNHAVDNDLAAIVEACLEVVPFRRPESAANVLEDLTRRRKRLPLLCRKPWSPGYRARRWVRRNASLWLAAVLATVLAGSGWLYQLDHRGPPSPPPQQAEKGSESREAAGLEAAMGAQAHSRGRMIEAALWWGLAHASAPGNGLAALASACPVELERRIPAAGSSHFALSADGARVALWDHRGNLRVVRVADGKQAFTLEHPPAVLQAAFSPDGATLLTCNGRDVRLTRAQGPQVVLDPGFQARPGWEAPDRVGWAGFAPDRERVAVVCDRRLDWYSTAGRPLSSVALAARPEQAGFGPDGTLVLVSAEQSYRVNGNAAQPLGALRSASISPDGRQLALVRPDGRLQVGPLKGGALRPTALEALSSVRFASNRVLLGLTPQGRLRGFDLEAWHSLPVPELAGRWAGPESPGRSALWTSPGEVALLRVLDNAQVVHPGNFTDLREASPFARGWATLDPQAGFECYRDRDPAARLSLRGPVRALALSEDGSLLAWAHPEGLQVLEVASGKQVGAAVGRFTALAWVRGALVAFGEEGRFSLSGPAWKPVPSKGPGQSRRGLQEVRAGGLELAPSASTLRVSRPGSRELAVLTLPSRLLCLQAEPKGGQVVAAGLEDGEVEAWVPLNSAPGLQPSLVPLPVPYRHQAPVSALSFSAAGKLASVTSQGECFVWTYLPGKAPEDQVARWTGRKLVAPSVVRPVTPGEGSKR